jgi:iron(III) transport system substrate-binding protein
MQMRTRSRAIAWRRAALAVCAAALMVMTGCSGGSSQSESPSGELVIDGEVIADAELWKQAKDEGTFVIYSAVTENRALAILDVFRKQVPDLNPEFVHLSGSQLFQRAEAEHNAGTPGADIIETTDKALAADEVKIGVFEPYCPRYANEFPEDGKDPKCNWLLAHIGAYGIAYNSAVVDAADAPKSWQDLLDPKWKGKIAMAQIGSGGSTWAYNLFLRNKYGADFWKGLAAQEPFLTSGAGDAAEALNRGEAEVAILPPSVASASIGDGAPLTIVRPADGLAGYGHYVGLAAGAEHPAAAKVYLNWVSSKAGQKAVAQAGGDYSLRKGMPGPTLAGEDFPGLDESGVVLIENTDDYLTKRQPWSDEWNGIFGYTP